MTDFPIDFLKNNAAIFAPLNAAGQTAAQTLMQKGYEVRRGLTVQNLGDILKMAAQPSILEYCLRDTTERFTDETAARRWLSKGREAFLLFKREPAGLRLAGYGWCGPGTTSHVPNGEATFALRVGEADQGLGLATPYSQVIISATYALYGAQDFWLEAWESNGGAVHIYHRLGFEDVFTEKIERLRPDGTRVPDPRIYMTYPNQLLI